jgi:glucan biosynthesis protein
MQNAVVFFSINPMGSSMFKIIGATVVYGLALLGLATYLKTLHPGEEL